MRLNTADLRLLHVNWVFNMFSAPLFNKLISSVDLGQVEVLSEGDFVNDLHVVVSGTVEASKYGSMSSVDEDMGLGPPEGVDNQLMSKRVINPGEPFGEVAFFTEISQPEVGTARCNMP